MTSYFRIASRVLGVATTGIAGYSLVSRIDKVEGKDPFSQHTREQLKKHPFSGMHEPFLPSPEQVDFVQENFPDCSFLLPTSMEDLIAQITQDTTVRVKSLGDREFNSEPKTIVVGGAPALISSANDRNITYINDMSQRPIAFGSAFHLEWDSPSEGPTSYLPSNFLALQIFRAMFPEKYLKIERTGKFPWRSLDWTAWIKHPEHWLEGVRIGVAFEKATRSMTSPENKKAIMDEVASRSKANEKFFYDLDRALGGKLLMPGTDSVIVARDDQEKNDLQNLKSSLANEGRNLRLLTDWQLYARYGFVPRGGVLFGEKSHDRVLSPDFMKRIAERITSLGGEVIDGKLEEILTDDPEKGGVVKFKTPDGKHHYQNFTHLVLSLGSQRILGKDGKPLFDIVSARGVSALGIAYIPSGANLPPSMVCGGTNNVTKLSGPVPMKKDNDKIYDGYLIRMTAAACITPNVISEERSNYDGTAATGLISAVRQTLDCEVEVLTVLGCNRQVSQYGQTHWMALTENPTQRSIFDLTPRGEEMDVGTHRPNKGIIFQMGAGGGGLTQAPSQPAEKLK